jgi:hypothetical protein
MKTITLTLLSCTLFLLTFISCQRDIDESTENNTSQQTLSSENPGIESVGYSITLAGPTQVNGNYHWIWTVKNTNPGNGNNGTYQDLSHWGMIFSSCFNINSVVSAGYSTNGTSWTNFTPTLKVDPSSCISVPVLKFDFGTSGRNTSYYRLILNINLPIAPASGYYKSGRKTGCGSLSFNGIGCIVPE